jgi:hypothetical protein
MTIDQCKIIELPRISDARGNLTFIEGLTHIPFEIKRTYYLYDVPGGSTRGSHAHKNLHQFMVAMSGSFDVVLFDGYREKRFHLNRSYYGLYVGPLMWRTLDNFSSSDISRTKVLDVIYYTLLLINLKKKSVLLRIIFLKFLGFVKPDNNLQKLFFTQTFTQT